MALSVGERHYNSPRKIDKFKKDLSVLPVWYAPPDATVLLHSSLPNDGFLDLLNRLNVPTRFMSAAQYWTKSQSVDELHPWGWNSSIYNEWGKKGRSSQVVDIAGVRDLSSRRHVIDVLSLDEITDVLPRDFIRPCIIRGVQEAKAWVERQNAVVLKTPWSSSGKGLYWVADGEWNEGVSQWCAKSIARQGYVMGERVYDKVLDLAMEFQIEDHNASFAGYSVFETENGRYKGNLLANDEKLEMKISAYVGRNVLERVKNILCGYFTEKYAQRYRGYMGVDMMVAKNRENDHFLHPCVEINLRMNMGVVAHTIYKRYIEDGREGKFLVKSYPNNAMLAIEQDDLEKNHPLVVSNGRVRSGYLPLSFNADATSIAYLIVG